MGDKGMGYRGGERWSGERKAGQRAGKRGQGKVYEGWEEERWDGNLYLINGRGGKGVRMVRSWQKGRAVKVREGRLGESFLLDQGEMLQRGKKRM